MPREDASVGEWPAGARVRLRTGEFAGAHGTVRRYQNNDVTVYVEIRSRTIALVVSPGDIELDDEDGGRSAGVREPRNPIEPAGGEAAAGIDD